MFKSNQIHIILHIACNSSNSQDRYRYSYFRLAHEISFNTHSIKQVRNILIVNQGECYRDIHRREVDRNKSCCTFGKRGPSLIVRHDYQS
jgi:hypothetical protein